VKKLKIGQYLAKMWTKVCGLLFGPPGMSYSQPGVNWGRRFRGIFAFQLRFEIPHLTHL